MNGKKFFLQEFVYGGVGDERKDGTRSCRNANLRARITATQTRFGALARQWRSSFNHFFLLHFVVSSLLTTYLGSSVGVGADSFYSFACFLATHTRYLDCIRKTGEKLMQSQDSYEIQIVVIGLLGMTGDLINLSTLQLIYFVTIRMQANCVWNKKVMWLHSTPGFFLGRPEEVQEVGGDISIFSASAATWAS